MAQVSVELKSATNFFQPHPVPGTADEEQGGASASCKDLNLRGSNVVCDEGEESSECKDGDDVALRMPDLENVSPAHHNLRNAFLRRVYGILTLQLALTVAICAFCALLDPVRGVLLGSPRLFIYGSIIPSLITLIAMHRMQKVHPWNAVLLFAFTVFESMTLGVVSAVYFRGGMAHLLVEAAALTLLIFFCLTAYVFISKKDFSFLGGFLFTALCVMTILGFVNIIFGFQASYIYLGAGVILFCGLILYDTSNIMKKYSYDEYIMACIDLYLDILNLFLYILRLLSSSRN